LGYKIAEGVHTMKLPRVLNRRTILPVAVFLVALWTGTAWAQTPGETSNRSWSELRAAWAEALNRGAPQAELEELEKEFDRFTDDEFGNRERVLARSSSILDRAFGYVWVSNLEHRIHNYNHQGRDGISCEYYPRQDGRRYRFHRMVTVGIGVPEGPWGNAQVLENSDYYVAHEVGDWEAADGSRGELFADPPQTRFDYPLMAISTLEATWPSSGWPAPEDVEEVWYAPQTWYKWKRVSEMEYYGEFTDQEAGRDGTGESYPLGITAKFRSMAYGAFDAVLVQYEFTNTSSTTYTDTYIGLQYYRAFPGRINTYYGFPRWDPSRQFLYCVGRNYDPATGYHTDSGGTEFSWGGYVYLQSPTGSWRLDPTVPTPTPADTIDTPSQVVTRLPLFHGSDRPTQADHEWGMYATMSGDVSLYEDPTTADNIWKHITQGVGQPILMQNENHWFPYWFGEPKPTDIDALNTLVASRGSYGFHFVSSGPFTWAPNEKVDYCVAFVAAHSEGDVLDVADKAIKSFQAQFQSSGPPATPRLETAGILAGRDGKTYDSHFHPYPIHYVGPGSITLHWDGTAAENSLDPITGLNDFQGYRIYKSINRGGDWGEEITDEWGNFVDYAPEVMFDLDDNILGPYPEGVLSLGDDTGLQHTWTDNNVLDGYEYWYAITAYDYETTQDPANPSYESPIGADPTTPNVIAVIASSKPNGYREGMVGSGLTAAADYSLYLPTNTERESTIYVSVVDEGQITGDTYTVSVVGDSAWYGTDLYPLEPGILLSNDTKAIDFFDLPVIGSKLDFGFDNIPVTDGFRVFTMPPMDASGVPQEDGGVYSFEITTDMSDSTNYTVSLEQAYMEGSGSAANRANRTGFMNVVEFRFTGWVPAAGDTNWIFTRSGGGYSDGDLIQCPFELWDIETNTRLMPGTYWPGQPFWDGDYFMVTNVPYYETDGVTVKPFTDTHPSSDSEYWGYDTSNPNSRSDWVYRLRFNERSYASNEDYWDIGDTWTLSPYKTLQGLGGNSFTFSTTVAVIEDSLINYDDIMVVPNPYLIMAEWDRSINGRMMQFTNVPPDATIDIYTLSGDLIASLDHGPDYHSSQVGTVVWNIWTYEFTEAAYGLYIYVVKVGGSVKKVGKFAIIR